MYVYVDTILQSTSPPPPTHPPGRTAWAWRVVLCNGWSRRLALWSLQELSFTIHIGSTELGQTCAQDLIWSVHKLLKGWGEAGGMQMIDVGPIIPQGRGNIVYQ